ncbi:hypothetical protein L2X74_003060, partial [Listeria monocytogenes]|nr:hypothetical protein [Listeria monocytogenes]
MELISVETICETINGKEYDFDRYDLIDMTAAHLAAKNSQTDVETLDQRLKKLEAAKEA